MKKSRKTVVYPLTYLTVAAWILAVLITGSLHRDTLIAHAAASQAAVVPPPVGPPPVVPPAAVEESVEAHAAGGLGELLHRWSLSSALSAAHPLGIAARREGGFVLTGARLPARAAGAAEPTLGAIEGLDRPVSIPVVGLAPSEQWLKIQTLRLAISVNLRTGPKKVDTMITPLPAGTLVVAALGQVDGKASALGKRAWAFVSAGSNISGWLWVGEANTFKGCLPHQGIKAWAGSAGSRVAEVSLGDARRFLGIHSDGVRSAVGLFAADAGCSLSLEHEWKVPGEIEQAFVVASTENSSPDLLIASSRDRAGDVEWSARKLDQDDLAWSLRVPAFPSQKGDERVMGDGPFRSATLDPGYFPLRMRWPGETEPRLFSWDGAGLVSLERATD